MLAPVRRDFRTAKGSGKKGSTGPPAYFLLDDLYEHFKVRQGITFWRPRDQHKQYKSHLGGLGNFVESHFTQPQTFQVPSLRLPKEEPWTDRIVKQRWELKQLEKERRRAEYAMRTQERLLGYDPHAYDEKKTADGYLTLFVGRLSTSVTDDELKNFMKANSGGEVTGVRIVRDLKYPKRSYGFVQFADEKSLQKAYHSTDGVLFGGQPIVTDVERGRTVRAWVPRKLGGGLGGPPRQKGYTLRKGRGAPEPPAPVTRKRRADRPAYGDRPPHPRMQQ